MSDRILAYALYVDPPLGRAGMTEREVRESGRRGLVATRPMSKVGRAREKGETQGFMKVLVDAETQGGAVPDSDVSVLGPELEPNTDVGPVVDCEVVAPRLATATHGLADR